MNDPISSSSLRAALVRIGCTVAGCTFAALLNSVLLSRVHVELQRLATQERLDTSLQLAPCGAVATDSDAHTRTPRREDKADAFPGIASGPYSPFLPEPLDSAAARSSPMRESGGPSAPWGSSIAETSHASPDRRDTRAGTNDAAQVRERPYVRTQF